MWWEKEDFLEKEPWKLQREVEGRAPRPWHKFGYFENILKYIIFAIALIIVLIVEIPKLGEIKTQASSREDLKPTWVEANSLSVFYQVDLTFD